jgi:DNA gyrase/topoisomerase IV subunit A
MQIVATEIPYQVNKAELQKKIADLVHEKVLEGISDIRDESDRDGVRVVIELKKGEVPGRRAEQLFKHTQFQTTFGGHHAGHRQRPAARAAARSICSITSSSSAATCPPAHRVRAEEGRGPRAHILEGLADRARPARRRDRADPRVGRVRCWRATA